MDSFSNGFTVFNFAMLSSNRVSLSDQGSPYPVGRGYTDKIRSAIQNRVDTH